MTLDTLPGGPGTLDSPFLRPSAGLFRNRRTRRPGEVNLKSCGLLHPRAAAVHAQTLGQLDPVDVLTYPDYRPAYAMLAERLGTTPDSLVLTAGSDPGLGLLTRAFPSVTRIVLHHPNYDGWSKFARIAGCEPDPVPADPATGRFVLGDLLPRLRQGPPAFVVVTQPHSLTGQVHEARQLAELAEAVGAHGSLLVLDTAYLAFTEGGEELVRGLTGLRHVVRVNSFSKCYGLSGARIAVLVAHPATARHLFDLDPEAPVSAVALALLQGSLRRHGVFEEVWAEVRGLRARFAERVEEALPGWRSRPGGGNFVTWDVPGPGQAASATGHLHEHGIVIRDLSGLPGLPAALRIAVADGPTVDRVVDLLRTWREGFAE
ncbi:aminotransferase class I/II-fold pyridoxal phosphate-dependent enzyme [Kitasatospora sp. NPDC056446]|uniref:aminotransferase class I/II-fold pyridoxal phosphate-dependent enzyme n=1 Tax=Kitasatospora sp. NPDC056446 TaxID=3345819 RepID=UPI0036B9C9BD